MPPQRTRTRTSFEAKLKSLPDEARDRVLERAAILWEGGMDDDEANRQAYEMETQAISKGVSKARERSNEAVAVPKSVLPKA